MLADLVTYDRSSRVYRVQITDDIVEFPAGANGRRNAYRLAVYVQDDALYAMADKLSSLHPELEARAWKAAGLVLDGKVGPAGNSHVLAYVEGTSEFGAYNITAVRGELCCDCPDWVGMTAPLLPTGRRLCKHIIAYLFSQNL